MNFILPLRSTKSPQACSGCRPREPSGSLPREAASSVARRRSGGHVVHWCGARYVVELGQRIPDWTGGWQFESSLCAGASGEDGQSRLRPLVRSRKRRGAVAAPGRQAMFSRAARSGFARAGLVAEPSTWTEALAMCSKGWTRGPDWARLRAHAGEAGRVRASATPARAPASASACGPARARDKAGWAAASGRRPCSFDSSCD